MRRYWPHVLAVVLGVAMAVLYVAFKPEPMPPGIQLPATPAPELKREETVPVATDSVRVYKPAVKAKLKLPAHVQADAQQHVVASTRTPNDDRPHTVTTTLNTATGEFTSYDRAEPLPWLTVSTRQHFGAYVGALNGEQAIAVTARQEVLRVKGLKVEGIAFGAMSQTERMAFVGVGASW